MAQNLGESIEAWGSDVWKKAEEIANHMNHEVEPFYIVFAAKQDKANPNLFRQAFKIYRCKPPAMFGLLVWYVDPLRGIFELDKDLSIPPDVPIDPSLLSRDTADEFPELMEKGKSMKALLS